MAHILETLGVSKLRLRGRLAEFNGFDRFFATLEEANLSLGDGDYVPEAGRLNAILLPEGIYIYSFDLAAFVQAGAIEAVSARADHYLKLDGNDDFITLDTITNSNIGRFDTGHSGWAVGFTVVEMTPIVDNLFMNVITNGTNRVMLRRGGSNMGIYYSNNGTQGAGANTWMAPETGDRILIQSEAASGRVQYWVNGVMKANTLTSQWADLTDDVVHIGDGSGFGEYGHFGIDNMVIMDGSTFGTVDRIEYFDSQELPADTAYYANLTDLLLLDGDGLTTEVNGAKAVINGDVTNGTAASFVEVPTS